MPYQHFSGGDDGVEYLMHIILRVAVAIQAISVEAFQSLILDSTVQEKAIAHPTDSRLLEVARYHVIKATQRVGFRLKQTFAQEARDWRRRAGGHAHARQFKLAQGPSPSADDTRHRATRYPASPAQPAEQFRAGRAG